MKAILILSDGEIKLVKAQEIQTIPWPDTPIALVWIGINARHIEGTIGGVTYWVLVGSQLIPHLKITTKLGIDVDMLSALRDDGWNIIDTKNEVLLTSRALISAQLK